MASLPTASGWPSLDDVRELFREHHRVAADIVDRAVALFGPAWAARFQRSLGLLFPTREALQAAVKGYGAFAMASMRQQARFERTREYAVKSYAEAAAEVYQNDDYMQAEYLPGLFLSHFLWPHHYRQIRFFETAFIEPLQTVDPKSFVEVGVGTGLYSRLALEALPGAAGTGFDVSPASKRFADRQMEAFGLSSRYRVELADIAESSGAEHLICVEVLEHLEDPVDFLRTLRRVLRPGGRAFITAALNAAHSDHIYLYRKPEAVEAQLLEAGFVTEQYFVGQAYASPKPGVPVPLSAAFVVY
jgi:2-polyprenyl-3-methyl-5-hydroxy-6-metoxy-1,4-benzoquinol methylase